MEIIILIIIMSIGKKIEFFICKRKMKFIFVRSNRGRGGKNFNRGRGRINNNSNNRNVSKEGLDTDLDKYMAQKNLGNDSVDMNAV